MSGDQLGRAAEPLQAITLPAHIAVPPSEAAQVLAHETEPRQDSTATPKPAEAKPVVPFHKLFSYADRFDGLLMILGCIGAAVNGATLPLFAIIFGDIINALGGSPTVEQLVHQVNKVCLYFVYLGIASFIASYAEVGLWMWTGVRQSNRMRHAYLASVLRQEVAYFDTDTSSGKLLHGLNEDTFTVQNAISEKVGNFVHHICTFLAGIAIAFAKAWDITLVVLAVVPLILAGAAVISIFIKRITTAQSEAYGKANGIASEALAAIRTVFSFNGEQRTAERYSNSLTKPMQAGIRGGFWNGLLIGFSLFAFLCAFALALWYGGVRVRDGTYTGGDVMSALFAALVGGMEVGQAAENVQFFQRGQAAAAQVFSVIARQPAIRDHQPDSSPAPPQHSKGTTDPGAASAPMHCDGHVELRGVQFAYPARPESVVLKSFSLQVPSGKTVALVGESGSGKSTIVGLLERFYDPQNGQVLLDGQDIRQVPLFWLRSQVGLVSQEPVLFATSIGHNIALGKPGASQQEVEEAARAANAHNFISSLPKGYETLVGERGVQMSGGQKQRIAIARAILKNPKVLLLDEATSALDSESERLVQAALDGLMAGRTTLIIAHRLSTIISADHIAVMKQGEIVEQGSHRELMQSPQGAYATLVRLQASTQHMLQDPVYPFDQKAKDSNQPEVVQAYSTLQDQVEVKVAIDKFTAQESVAQSILDGDTNKKTKHKEEKVQAGFGRLLRMNMPEWHWAVLGSAASAGLGVLWPAFGLALAQIVGIYYNPDLNQQKHTVQKWCIVFAVVGFGGMVCSTLQQYAFTLMGQKLTRRLRVILMKALLKQEVGWFDRTENSSGAISSRLSTDALYIRGAVGDQLGVIIQNLVTVTAAYVIAFIAGWKMTLVITAVAPLVGVGAWLGVKAMTGFSNEASKLFNAANQTAAEAVHNARTVAAFCLQPQLSKLYGEQLAEPTRSIRKNSLAAGLGFGYSQASIYVIYALGFWYGGKQIAAGDMSFTDMLKVFFCITFAASGLAGAQMSFPDITKASGAVKRVFSVIDREPIINPNSGSGVVPSNYGGRVELRGVSFRYPSRPEVQVFRNFSLTVEAGRSLALVGQSGNGKSTVISLIQRFYDVEAGQVLVNGCDVRDLDLQQLRSQIGLVSQEPVLFSSTVGDNISYGNPDASQQQVEDAARAANAHSFVSKLPEGYNTQVGEGGIQLSGGQKQRVAIARAILKDPKILLLDEATSALDAESERLVQDALEHLMVGRTTIIVAHRLSTIKNADSIAVVQQGEIVEQGSHDQLIRVPGGAYASLIRHQQQR